MSQVCIISIVDLPNMTPGLITSIATPCPVVMKAMYTVSLSVTCSKGKFKILPVKYDHSWQNQITRWKYCFINFRVGLELHLHDQFCLLIYDSQFQCQYPHWSKTLCVFFVVAMSLNCFLFVSCSGSLVAKSWMVRMTHSSKKSIRQTGCITRASLKRLKLFMRSWGHMQ